MKTIMRLFILGSIVITQISMTQSVQTIPQENVQGRIDAKRLHPRQQLTEQSKGHLLQDERKSLYQRPSPMDSLMQFAMAQSKRQKANSFNKVTLPQSNMYVADTVFVFNTSDTSRYLYDYSPSGKMTVELYQHWLNNQWVTNERRTSTYDANGNQLTYLYEQWSNNQWVNRFRYTSTYDANGNQLTYLYEQWSNNRWVNSLRETSTYDANGNQLTSLGEYWSSNQWVYNDSSTSTYDANGNQLTYWYESWFFYNWLERHRYTYTYDANGNRLSELWEVWSSGRWGIDGHWARYIRLTYTYDTNGNRLSEFWDIWSNDKWVNYIRSTYTYDTNGNRLSEFWDIWSNNQWKNNWRSTYTYDANGNQLTDLYEECPNNQWVNSRRFTYKYVFGNLLSEGLAERWYGDSWEPYDQYTDEGQSGNPIFREGYKILFSYKLIITDVNKNDDVIAKEYSLWQNYPNPFNPSTTITFSIPERSNVRLSIFNTLGQNISEIMNETKDAGSYEQSFNASQLSSGIYFYRIEAVSTQNTGKTFVETKKMVLMR